MNVYGRSITRLGAILAIIVLQIAVEYLNMSFDRRVEHWEFDLETFSYALLIIILGVLSGFLLSYMLLQNRRNVLEDKKPYWHVALLGVVPLVVIGYKLVFSLNPDVFPSLRSPQLELWTWAVRSQVPPFWLGIVIGWVMEHKLYLKSERHS